VAGKLSFIDVGRRDSRSRFGGLLGLLHLFFPGAGLPFEQADSHFNFLRLPSIDHPDDLAAGFFVTELDADDLSRFQAALQARELGAMMANVSGPNILQEWTTLCTHPKYSDRQLDIQPGFWFF
jgi:hypothetical protein